MDDEKIKALRERLRRIGGDFEQARSMLAEVEQALEQALNQPRQPPPPERWVIYASETIEPQKYTNLEKHEVNDPELAIDIYRQVLGRTEYEGRQVQAILNWSGNSWQRKCRFESDFTYPLGMGRIAPDDPRLSTELGYIASYNVRWSLPKPRKSRRKAAELKA